jgi:hypothetical protein
MLKLLLITQLLFAAVEKTATEKINLSEVKNAITFQAVIRPGGAKINGAPGTEVQKPLAGQLEVKDNKISGDATFQLKAFNTGISLRDSHLKDKYLQVEQYPEAKLKMKSFAISETGAPFEGTLTLHGKENKVSGIVKSKKVNNKYDLSFDFDVNIKDYGIEVPSYLGVRVEEKVKIEVNIKS